MVEVPERDSSTAPPAQPRASRPSESAEIIRTARFHRGAIVHGGLAITIALTALAGWLFQLPILASLSSHWVVMKSNTAVCIALAGIALILISMRSKPRATRAVIRFCSIAVLVVGALTATEYMFGWDLGIDQLLFREAPGALATSAPGRMALSSAVCFMLVGASLVLRVVGRPEAVRWAQRLALVTTLMGTLSLLGYVYSVPAFSGVISYAPMAVHTAGAFVLLGVGILLSSPNDGFMSVVSSSGSGGMLARRMLPVVICLPPLLGILRILGARADWYPTEFGISLKDGVIIVMMAGVVWVSARRANRLDEAQKKLMVERSAALENLQQTYDALENTNSNLLVATAAADRANRAKSEFLSRMSHELRTPLNAILGFAQLLEMGKPDEEQTESIEEITRGGRHLLALTNDILDISRIESGRLSLSLEPVQMGDVLEESLALISPLAAQRGIALKPTRDSTWDAFVIGDQQRLRQIVLNLLSNAVKYNRPSGSVEVSCRSSSEGRVQIHIADTGPGIQVADQESLFEPFERLGAEQTEVEGTGLGLALSKRLAESMRGSISLTSEVGRGTTFVVELRGAESPLQQHVAELDRVTPSSSIGSGRVLYIEDNQSNLRLVERTLASYPDIELLTATTGTDGLELAYARHPDIVLVDLNLPDIGGDVVLARLRNHLATEAIPVIVLSADATPRRIKELYAAGAHAYITKPIDLNQLLEAIQGLQSREVVG